MPPGPVHPAPSTREATSQAGRVVFALREMLLKGEFQPGERLAEISLSARLETSRTPVRLALERLAHEGLLESLPAGGFRVRAFAVEEIWDAIEIRGVLEGTAARLSAERLTGQDELAPLRRSLLEQAEISPSDLSSFVRYFDLNDAFHMGIWRLAKSPMLLRAIESVIALPFAAPSALVFGPPGANSHETTAAIALEHHRSLVEAIGNREGARAEALAREHAQIARRNLLEALRDVETFRRIPGAALVSVPGPAVPSENQ